MFLRDKLTGDLIRVDDLDSLWNPHQTAVIGRDEAGEEEQEPCFFDKNQLAFPSGEDLPRCWRDVHYRSRMASCDVEHAS